MKLLLRYFRYIDACLAEMTDAGADGVVWQIAWNDLIGIPLLLIAVPTAGPGILLAIFDGPAIWGAVSGVAFLTVATGHALAVFWRWLIFDYEDFTGKKAPDQYGDMS